MMKLAQAALLIIDVQKAIDAAYHADEVHSISLANLSGEYCTVVDTAAFLSAQ